MVKPLGPLCMRARYPLVLALVVLLALAPPAVASEAARAPTAQAGELWLLVLEPTAAFAPGADEPAWVAEPGEWYWVINRIAARDSTGTGVWALAAWEFDPPSAAVLIRLDERVQQFLEPAPPPPPPPPSPPPTSTRPEPTPTAIPVSCTTQSARSSPLAVIPPGQVYLTANGFAPFASVSWTAIAMPAGGFLDPPTTTTAANALCTATQTINMGPDAPAGTWTLRASGTAYGGQPLALTVSFVVQRQLLLPTPLPLPTARPPTPSDSDLVVTVLSIGGLSGSFPTVNGRVCNRAIGWKATGIRIEFAFYYDSLLPTLDSGSHYVSEVGAGDCRSFTASLIALQRWTSIVVSRVSWTWEPER